MWVFIVSLLKSRFRFNGNEILIVKNMPFGLDGNIAQENYAVAMLRKWKLRRNFLKNIFLLFYFVRPHTYIANM